MIEVKNLTKKYGNFEAVRSWASSDPTAQVNLPP